VADPTPDKRISRRGFLAGLGIGLGAAGAAGVAAGVSLGRTELRLGATIPGNFSRMFPNLPPFFQDLEPGGATDQLRDAMRDIGKLGGPLDAKDDISAGPVALIANAAVNGNDPPRASRSSDSSWISTSPSTDARRSVCPRTRRRRSTRAPRPSTSTRSMDRARS
jgi:hypothetical protein